MKTIETNKNDIEAYKLLAKISLKQGEYENIITLLETRLEKEENGDIYYILSQVYKKIGNKEAYLDKLEKSLENNLTLTYSQNEIKYRSIG